MVAADSIPQLPRRGDLIFGIFSHNLGLISERVHSHCGGSQLDVHYGCPLDTVEEVRDNDFLLSILLERAEIIRDERPEFLQACLFDGIVSGGLREDSLIVTNLERAAILDQFVSFNPNAVKVTCQLGWCGFHFSLLK